MPGNAGHRGLYSQCSWLHWGDTQAISDYWARSPSHKGKNRKYRNPEPAGAVGEVSLGNQEKG
jgi:hypothetical protein